MMLRRQAAEDCGWAAQATCIRKSCRFQSLLHTCSAEKQEAVEQLGIFALHTEWFTEHPLSMRSRRAHVVQSARVHVGELVVTSGCKTPSASAAPHRVEEGQGGGPEHTRLFRLDRSERDVVQVSAVPHQHLQEEGERNLGEVPVGRTRRCQTKAYAHSKEWGGGKRTSRRWSGAS